MTAAVTVIPATEAGPTLALLKYLGDLLGEAQRPNARDVLHQLGRLFGARGAGMARLSTARVQPEAAAWIDDAAPPDVLSWQNDIATLRRLAERSEPAPLEDDGGSWLFWFATQTGSDERVVLWLNDIDHRHWSSQDGAALALAGQALRRIGLFSPPAGESVEERLRQGALVASRLSHDVGNLLTGVLGFTELTMAQVTAGTRAHEYLQEVWNVACGGADWLKKLNFFCRRNPPEFTPSGLPGVLAEEQARLGATAASVHTDLPVDLPALACDSESLRQALRQVLDNARDATGGREPVHVAARAVDLPAAAAGALLGQPPPGRYVEIVVTDRGPGISDDVRGRLFKEWFFSSKPRHRGMGLMMAYGIVHRFGGGLTLARPTEGGTADGGTAEGGTQVRLYFPAASDPVPAGPARLLVVDDDPQILADARGALEPAGYQVQVAGSAAEAVVLHQTATPRFDLVLMTGHLPNVSGVDLARRMLLRDPHARFLFLHAPAGPALPRDELVRPAMLVHKPITGPVLLQAVAAALRQDLSAASG